MGVSDKTKFFDYDLLIPNTTAQVRAPGDRSFSQVVVQSGKLVLDSELNLSQDLATFTRQLLAGQSTPSGFLINSTHAEQFSNFSFRVPSDPDFLPNSFHMDRREAIVAGFPIVVEYTLSDTPNDNIIPLSAATLYDPSGEVNRTDFVFLEVWQALIAPSPHAFGTITVNTPIVGSAITVEGPFPGTTTFSAVAALPAPNEFEIGGDDVATAVNLAAAINAFPGLLVYAKAAGDVVYVIAIDGGAAGNLFNFSSADPVTLIPDPVGGFLAGGVDMPNKPDQTHLYRHGNVYSSSSVALGDDLIDPTIARETAQRVQVQYRIRATGSFEAVNFKTQMDGFSSGVLAQGSQVGGTVAGYPFVPADGSTVSGNSSAVAYGTVDTGLWIAGNGTDTAAAALGTVDGFVYAIPMAFVFRHNDASTPLVNQGWGPVSNANGAPVSNHGGYTGAETGWLVPPATSDRPDGAFCDAISETMVLDLRRHVSPVGFDFKAVLHQQFQSLMDGSFRTWAINTQDKQELGLSGDVSTKFLVCNEVGRGAEGGAGDSFVGDTPRGVTIGQFDHIRRRFADQAVVERAVFAFYPTDLWVANPGKYVSGAAPWWQEDSTLVLDLDHFNVTGQGGVFHGLAPSDTSTEVFTDVCPPGTRITDLLSIYHDDGNWNLVGGFPVDQTVQIKTATGLGTPKLEVVLDFNDTPMTGGLNVAPYGVVDGVLGDAHSTRRIFMEVEITYPLGVGLTDTPTQEVVPTVIPGVAWEEGPLVQNDVGQRPADMYDPTGGINYQPLPPAFREGYRETDLEYVASLEGSPADRVVDQIVSRDPLSLVFPRRLWSWGPAIQDLEDMDFRAADTANCEYGSSSRLVAVDAGGLNGPLSGAGQTLCSVAYYAQDAIPNYGLSGYQVSVYFRANAPQTFGTKAGVLSDPVNGTLPVTLTVEPLAMSESLWTGQVGKGSQDLPYPYVSPLDQIPHYDGMVPAIAEEWFYCATAMISVADFNADVGLLSLHPFVQADGSSEIAFGGGVAPLRDAEFRSLYRVVDTNTYRPTIMAQPLAGSVRHKVFFPFLARIPEDVKNANGGISWRSGELVLIVISRLAELDDQNTIRFLDLNNRTCAAVYRTRNLLLTVGKGLNLPMPV